MSSVQDRASLTRSTLIDSVARVDLRVTNVERALSFYRDVVGLRVLESHASRGVFGSGNGSLLTVDSTGVSSPADPRATGLFHVAIRFPTRAALGDALARLVDAGLEIGAGDHLVSEALYVDDPDGNGIELYWDRPVDQWPAPSGGMIVPMATLPVDLEGLLAEGRGREAVGASAPEGTDVGHVHLQVSDIARTEAFYTNELGLDLIARLGGSAAFLSSNGYHHNIGANTWRSRGSEPSKPERAGLVRIVFAVSDADQLERLRLRLLEHGRAVTGGEDRDVVVADPDGIELNFVLAR